MMGKIRLSFALFFCALSLQAEYYNIKVKTVATNTTFPDAIFFAEVGSSQMKGFEAQVRPVGFGAEGIKTITVQNQELREKIEKAMREELDMKGSVKLDNLHRKLENNYKRLELALSVPPEKDLKSNRRGISVKRAKQAQEEAEFMKGRAAARAQAAYDKAKAEFEKFDALYQRAKRNRNIEKTLVAEIDEKIKLRYDKLFQEAIIPDGTLPYGTFVNINFKKVSGKTAVIDFEYAISRMLGWIQGDGTNNNNAMNTSMDMEYIELPKIENVKVEIGKPYCFQIARPEEQGGTLTQAQNMTSIFATDNKTKTIDAGLAEKSDAPNPLTTHGDYNQIRTKFKGKDKKVVRVLVTITPDSSSEK